MIRVLFVCLGNICRSPAAEGVMKNLVRTHGLENKFEIQSAGTAGYHEGESADPRMSAHASRRGYKLDSLAQKFQTKFFDEFDYIITMDRSNYQNVLKLATNEGQEKKVIPMAHLCEAHSVTEVPDPYHDGAEGFELVLDLVEDGCKALLQRIKDEKSL